MALSFLAKKQPTPQEVKTLVREAVVQMAADDKHLTQPAAEVIPDLEEVVADSEHTGRSSGSHKLSQLIDADFPFDESQLSAVEGMVESRYACLTGAAGTGKTTTTKKLVDRLLETSQIGAVNMAMYWKSDFESNDDMHDHSHGEYDADSDGEKIVPSVALVTFTGRASQQVKGNFPDDWHGNIMTIHRCLGFFPEPYEDWDPDFYNEETGESGRLVTKRRFVPTYTADFKLPWDIVLIDEAGMLGLDLWHQLWAAMKPGARVYMIGDINQLPPVHGKSIFGFALAKWPAYELTHVHRQQGKDNPIVDNAWRVIHGQMPVSGGRFQMIPLKGDATMASRKVRGMVPALMEKKIYDPIRDTIITPINGEDGSKGYALGQLPLNKEFARIFNPENDNPRYLIDGGRVKQLFAVGDKVMATKNDWEAGITNGMTGIIESIATHGGYTGESERYGILAEINARMKADDSGLNNDELISIDDLSKSFLAIEEGNRNKKEKRERGPSSHIVTVRFGTGDHSFTIAFATLAEVGSLMTAYAVTCHKMQGGESPVVIIILHDAHKAMLYREWLYTAITRASEMCILLYAESALKTALNKQSIKGQTLKEKIASFNAWMNPNDSFDAMSRSVQLPEVESTGKSIMEREERKVVTPARLTTEAEKAGGLASLVTKARIKIEVQHVHIHRTVAANAGADSDRVADVDGGQLHANPTPTQERPSSVPIPAPVPRSLPAPDLVPLVGVARQVERIARLADQPLLLTHQPQPIAVPEAPVKKTGLSFLMKKKV